MARLVNGAGSEPLAKEVYTFAGLYAATPEKVVSAAPIATFQTASGEEWGGNGGRRMGDGRTSTRGTPQGGVASPLLANIYMNRFLKHWRITGRGEAFRAQFI